MIKSRMSSLCVIVMALSCGVNTGNPKGVILEPETRTSTSTTLILDLKSVDAGQIALQVEDVRLVPEGGDFDSSKSISLKLRDSPVFRSGQKITLASQEPLAAGSYDRMVIVLSDSNPASLRTAAGDERAIALAPYQYYAQNGDDASVQRRQLVLSLKQKTLQVNADSQQSLELGADLATNLQDFSAISPSALEYFKGINQLDFAYSLNPYSENVVVRDSAPTDASLLVTVVPAYFTIHTICVYRYDVVAQGTSVNDDTLCTRAAYIANLTVTPTRGYAAFSIPGAMYVLVARNETGELLYMQTVALAEGEQSSITFPYVPDMRE